MARAKAKKTPDPKAISGIAPTKILRSRGPLSPRETEIILYAGLKSGEVTATPNNIEVRSRPVANLITDDSGLTGRIAHKTLRTVSTKVELRKELLAIYFARQDDQPADNQASVAGTQEIVDSVLGDAYKIVLFLEDGDTNLPPYLADWKASKPDNRTSPPSITLVCI